MSEVDELRLTVAKLKKLSALAINQMCGPMIFAPEVDGPKLRAAALEHGLFEFDDHHHAPACPANYFHKTQLPSGRCTCGAARAAERRSHQ